jgi:hypothetical protein
VGYADESIAKPPMTTAPEARATSGFPESSRNKIRVSTSRPYYRASAPHRPRQTATVTGPDRHLTRPTAHPGGVAVASGLDILLMPFGDGGDGAWW